MSNGSNNSSQLSPIKQALLALEELQSRLDASEREKCEPVAIVGMGCRFPGGANSPSEFWNLLRNGVDAIREVPSDRWNARAYYDSDPASPAKSNTRWGGFLDGISLFDPLFFGISPREAASMDPQQRLLLEVSWEALEDAGYRVEQMAGSRTGVFIGIYNSDYFLLQTLDPNRIDAHTATGNAHSIVANRLSYLLDLRGPSLAVDTACSSSLVATHLALRSLRSKECDIAFAGGVNLMLSPLSNLAASKALTMAADGRCKTFDSRVDGIVRGEGCGVVVLKRLSDAVRDSDSVWAVIRGSAVNQDGRSNGLTAPNLSAQEDVISEALKDARIGPSQITYIEAHGTATPLGDPIEVEALASVFAQTGSGSQSCAIASVKTNIGHLEASAGIAGLIKTALSLKHRMIAPHLHFERLNPNISLSDTPFYIPKELTPWQPVAGRRFAGVSSFSFGGTNAHVILEEASEPKIAPEQESKRAFLFPISARSPEAIPHLAAAYRDYLLRDEEGARAPLQDICYTAGSRRSHFKYRAAFAASSRSELIERLDCFLRDGSALSPDFVQTTGARKGLAFVYSGQGTQWFGMCRDLLEQEPEFRDALEKCDKSFRQLAGWSLLEELTCGQSKSSIDRTEIAQPLIFAVQVALTALWRSWGVIPDSVVGHSLGEVTAAHVAGALSLDDALKIVFHRSSLMRRVEGKGKMVSVALPASEISPLLESYDGRLSIAAINTAKTTLITGDTDAVEAFLQTLRNRNTHYRLLAMNYAFHSAQMDPIAVEIEEALRGLKPHPARISFFSTVTGSLAGGRNLDAAYWRRNVREPVRFADAVKSMLEEGCGAFLEVSPQPVLSGEISRYLNQSGIEAKVFSCSGLEKDGRASLLRSLGALYATGFDLEWGNFFEKGARKVRLPHYCWQRKRYWIESTDSGFKRPVSQPDPAPASPESSPLLSSRLPAAVPIFQAQLQAESLSYLRDHKIMGSRVIPVSVFLEMALQAAHQSFGAGRHVLRDLVFHKALSLPDQTGCLVQLVMSVEAEEAAFQIFSLDASKTQPDLWVLQAGGRILIDRHGGGSTPDSEVTLQELRSRFPDPLSVEEHYAEMHKRGIEYGTAFRNIKELYGRKNGALGYVKLPPPLASEARIHNMHPALLDACLQILRAAQPEDENRIDKNEIYYPAGIEQFCLTSEGRASAWSHASLRGNAGSKEAMLIADIQLFSDAGEVVGEISGFCLKRAGDGKNETLQRDFDDWLYEITWEHKPNRASEETRAIKSHAPIVAGIARELEPEFTRLSSEHGLDDYAQLAPQLDGLCVDYILQAFNQLGWKPRPSVVVSTGSLITAWGVPPHNHRLLGRLIEILGERRLLKKHGAEWLAAELPQASNPEGRLKTLLDKFPEYGAELTLLADCGKRLAEVLQGKVNPLDLLFPNGSLEGAESLYQKSPFGRTYNNLVRQAVAKILEKSPRKPERRILEIGGGTGGTTSFLLPELQNAGVQYTFTDVSNLFISRAARKFREYSFLRYGLLDVEIEPQAQGFAPRQFDVILAANVLHATRDLRAGLKHIRELLSEDGALVLLEGTSPRYWLDLTFGLTAGWWKFADTDLRPAHPLLSREGWQSLLGESGFTEISAIPGGDSGEALILARGPGADARAVQNVTAPGASQYSGAWIILEDEEGVGRKLAGLIESHEAKCILVSRGEAADFQEIRKLIRKAGENSEMPLRGIINLWSLDAEGLDQPPGEDLERSVAPGCRSTLFLVKALVESGLPSPPKLWLITRGSQFTEQGDMALRVEQAPLWGLGRVIAMEHPDLWGGLIDLDLNSDASSAASMLFEEIGQSGGEDQIAFRRERRYVPRLTRHSKERTSSRAFQLDEESTYLITGGMGGMGLKVARWMIDSGARHIALIGRSGATEAEIREVAGELEQTGVKIITGRVNVSDKAALAGFLNDLNESSPPLRGVIHAAGIFDDRVLAHHDWERFVRVLSPKVSGAWNLHTLTLNIPLDFFVFFSSSATIFGPTGLGNYAAANVFLDALANYRKQLGLPGLSIDWGPWAKTGMAEAVGEIRESQWKALGMETIPAEQALEVLGVLIAQPSSQVAVMPMIWPEFMRRRSSVVSPMLESVTREARQNEYSLQPSLNKPGLFRQLELATAPERRALLIDYLRSQVTRILGLEPSLRIDSQRPLMELGLDSLIAIELRNSLAISLELSLPATLLFDHSTIESLTDYIIGEVLFKEPAAAIRPEPQKESEDLTELLAGVEQMSEEEARRLLSDFAGGPPGNSYEGDHT